MPQATPPASTSWPDTPSPEPGATEVRIVGIESGAVGAAGAPVEPDRPKLLATVKLHRGQLLVGFLCALLGFALVIQVRGSAANPFANLRQEDLVRLLEDVTVRGAQLADEVARLEATRQELATSGDQRQAALEVARQRAAVEGILSGRLPAQGPGLEISITDPFDFLTAAMFVNLLEELRNAGAEVVQVGNYRVTTSSAFTDELGGVFLDGNALPSEVRWLAIGDPATMGRALEIPGGALPQIRIAGGETEVTESDQIEITATATLRIPQYAVAVPTDP